MHYIYTPVACPLSSQVRRVCAPHPNCMSTCSQEVSVCTEFCSINDCGCPISKVLNNHHNECVSLSECPGKDCDYCHRYLIHTIICFFLQLYVNTHLAMILQDQTVILSLLFLLTMLNFTNKW